MASPRSKSSSSSSSSAERRRPSRGHSPSTSVGTHHHQLPQLGLGSGALPSSTQSPPAMTPSSSSVPPASGVHSTTTTPTKAVQSLLVVSGRGSGGSRKRGRGGNDGSSGSGGDKRGKGELDAPKETDPNCGLCGKRFHSWKAYFGHLRAHPEREWRGAFPPPTTTGTGGVPMDPESSRRLLELKLAPTLLGIAAEIQAPPIDTDINVAPPAGARRALFDLNRSPPPEDEDEDEEEDKKEDKGKGYI